MKRTAKLLRIIVQLTLVMAAGYVCWHVTPLALSLIPVMLSLTSAAPLDDVIPDSERQAQDDSLRQWAYYTRVQRHCRGELDELYYRLAPTGELKRGELRQALGSSSRLRVLLADMTSWRELAGWDGIVNYAEWSAAVEAIPWVRKVWFMEVEAIEPLLFRATSEWQAVPSGAMCPAGLEYRIDLATGQRLARLPEA